MPTTATTGQEAAWAKAWRAWDAARGDMDAIAALQAGVVYDKRPTLQQQLDTGYVEVPGDGRTALPLPRLDDWNGSIVGFGPKVSLLRVPVGCTLIDGHCMIRDLRCYDGSFIFTRDSDNNEANFNTIRNVVLHNADVHVLGSEFSSLENVWGIGSASLWYDNGQNYKSPPPTNSRHTMTNVGFPRIAFYGNTQHVDGRGVWCPLLLFAAFPVQPLGASGGIGRVPHDIRIEGAYSDSRNGVGGVAVSANGFVEHNKGTYPDSIVINGRPLASWVGAAMEPIRPTDPVRQVIDALSRGIQT